MILFLRSSVRRQQLCLHYCDRLATRWIHSPFRSLFFSENSDTRRQNTNIYIANYTWKVRRNVFFMCLVDKVESGISNKYRRGGEGRNGTVRKSNLWMLQGVAKKAYDSIMRSKVGLTNFPTLKRANRFVEDDRRLSGICRWQPWDSCFQSQGEDWFYDDIVIGWETFLWWSGKL